MVIRKARKEDLPALLRIERECFASHRFSKEQFQYYLRGPCAIMGVADEGGAVVGYTAGIVDHRGRGKTARLYSMAVSRGHRRAGVGASLLRDFEKRARRSGCRAVTLEVYEHNKPALSLYRSFGYAPESRLDNYYARGRHGLRMRKTLSRKER